MLKDCLDRVRQQGPLIHSITNYVTANDCANILLACGASPIMADDPLEAEEITALCAGLNLNLGTLSTGRAAAMLAAGRKANALSHPVVLDPVGVGASRFRRNTAGQLLETLHFTAIRGNLSEILALARCQSHGRGVDAGDRICPRNLNSLCRFAMDFSRQTGAVIVITGEEDIVAEGNRACILKNGHPMMGRVTGTGCQLSALTAAFVAANRENTWEAAVAAAAAMGICGELARERMQGPDGSMSYGHYIIDAVSNLDGETLEARARYQKITREEIR